MDGILYGMIENNVENIEKKKIAGHLMVKCKVNIFRSLVHKLLLLL